MYFLTSSLVIWRQPRLENLWHSSHHDAPFKTVSMTLHHLQTCCVRHEGRGNRIQPIFKAWPRPTPGGSSASSFSVSMGALRWALVACTPCMLPTSFLLTCSSCSHDLDVPLSLLPQSVMTGWSWGTLRKKDPMLVGVCSVVKCIPCMHEALGWIPSYNTPS